MVVKELVTLLVEKARTSEHGYDKESRKKSKTMEMNWMKRDATIEQGCEVTLSSTLKKSKTEEIIGGKDRCNQII
jgi:hypothetical protein